MKLRRELERETKEKWEKNMTFKLDAIEKYISNSSDGSNRIRLKCKLIWTMLHNTGAMHTVEIIERKYRNLFLYSLFAVKLFSTLFLLQNLMTCTC